VLQRLAASPDATDGTNRDQLTELRLIVERRLSGNSVWLAAFHGFVENPADADLRANLEFILHRIGSSDPDFLAELGRSLGVQPPAATGPLPASSVHIDLKGSKNKIKDVAGRDINKNRTIRIGTTGLLALVLLGGGSYTVYHSTRSEPALSSSPMSLPGISINPPKGWTSYPVNSPLQLAMSPPRTGSCPTGLASGSLRCVEAVTLSRTPSNIYSGNSPQAALQETANGRFSRLSTSIRQVDTLNHQALTINGCPAYEQEWRVSWSQPPSTLEEFVFVRTPTAVQGTNLGSVFIRLADSGNSSPQALMDAMVSSIQCN
jgi:hypothetical protein